MSQNQENNDEQFFDAQEFPQDHDKEDFHSVKSPELNQNNIEYNQQQSLPEQQLQIFKTNTFQESGKPNDQQSFQEEEDEGGGGFFQNLLNGKLFNEVKERLGYVQQELKNEFNHLDLKFRDGLRSQKEKLNQWIRTKVEQQLRPQIQETIKDPYMPECVKDFMNDAVDEVWPGIEEEVLFKLRLKIANPIAIRVNEKPDIRCFLLYPWQWFKQWYLYTTQPFDRSFWQQIRTISWWFFVVIKLIPFYGIQQYFFLFVYLMIDKEDEFQLVNFVLNFKRMQFLSVGGFGGLFGYFVFYSCTTVNQQENPNYYKRCQEQGPALFFDIWTDMLGFLIQISLVWVTFGILPCSRPKGKLKFTYARRSTISIEEQPRCFCCVYNVNRGGRLKGFIIWDVFSFIACLLLFLFLSYGGSERKEWQIKATMYLVKTMYGILSFPFIVFIIPFMTFLFTRARETGYDEYGNCVPKIKDLKQYHKEKQRQYMLKQNKNVLPTFDVNYVKIADLQEEQMKMQKLFDDEILQDLIGEEEESEQQIGEDQMQDQYLQNEIVVEEE